MQHSSARPDLQGTSALLYWGPVKTKKEIEEKLKELEARLVKTNQRSAMVALNAQADALSWVLDRSRGLWGLD
jgi:hypothetical protein